MTAQEAATKFAVYLERAFTRFEPTEHVCFPLEDNEHQTESTVYLHKWPAIANGMSGTWRIVNVLSVRAILGTMVVDSLDMEMIYQHLRQTEEGRKIIAGLWIAKGPEQVAATMDDSDEFEGEGQHRYVVLEIDQR